MQQNRSGPIVIILVGMLLSLFAMLSVLLTQGNSIGELSRYILVGGFFLGCLQPRLAFFVWLIACAYNDLLKRFLVVGGRMSFNDITFVLGITPMMFGGVVLSMLLMAFTGRIVLKPANWRMFILASVLMILSGILTALGNDASFNGILKSIANEGIYAYLLFVLPLLIPTEKEVYSMLRYLVLVFLPVAIYGIYQQIFGFSEIEIAYLKTGFTIEVKQLLGIEGRRAFSTLNSSSALSVVCAVLSVLSLHLGLGAKRAGLQPLISPILSGIMSIIYFGGLLASTCRSAVVMAPVALVLGYAFVNKKLTSLIYSAMAVCFVILVALSPYLLNNINYLMDKLTIHSGGDAGEWMQRMTTVGTYSDRLMGFTGVLLNPSAYTLFGKGKFSMESGEFFQHDPISNMLLRYGLFGWVVAGLMLYVIGRTLHRAVWSAPTFTSRVMAARFLGIGFSMLCISAVGGSILHIFPINVFFWLMLAGALVLHGQATELPVVTNGEDSDHLDTAVPSEPMPRAGRFRPVPPKTALQ
jgi:hypothetical protein